MAGETVLVVEDEEDIRELVRYTLTSAGYRVSEAASGEEALRRARANPPDLLLLDLLLPGLHGLDVCRLLRADESAREVPIVMLTARGEDSDIVAGLEAGADDYITKPFSTKVLTARVKAVLRRSGEQVLPEGEAIAHGSLSIDPRRFEVTVGGAPCELTATEFRILHYLARHPGWVFTRTQIVEAVRGEDYPVTDRSVDVHIVGLRRKLGRAAERIETVRGVGYRYRE
ncbi:MAG: response regulator [Armatimonadetes bacterium]|nr:response regulator [Armatimonadota bacterium]